MSKNHHQELHLGMSISHIEHERGTLGAFVVDNDDRPGILSCNHVLLQDRMLFPTTTTSTLIVEPGNSPLEQDEAKRTIANCYTTQRKKKIRTDSAFAVLLDTMQCQGNIVPLGFEQFGGLPIFKWPSDKNIKKGTLVYKIGAETGITSGIMNGFSARIPIRGQLFDAYKVFWHDYETPFSLGGDSGSLAFICEREELFAIGMVFAGFSLERAKKLLEYNEIPFSYVCRLNDICNDTETVYI